MDDAQVVDSLMTKFALSHLETAEVTWPDCPVYFFAGRANATSCFPLVRAGGAGLSRHQALRRMLGEACELASIQWQGNEPVLEATASELCGQCISPEVILLLSTAQYDGRDAWNTRLQRWEPIPPPRDPARPIYWSQGVDLDGHPIWLPSACCFSKFVLGYHEFAVADSNGCAAAPSYDEAIRAAFLELCERDAVARWWHAAAYRPGVILESQNETDHLGELLGWIRDRPRTLVVLDLSLGEGVVVFAAITHNHSGREVALGFGASFAPQKALESALLELLQCELMIRAANGTESTADAGVSLWRDLVSVESHPCLQAHGNSMEHQIVLDGEEHRDDIRRALESRGLRAVVLDLSRADIGVPVVRLVVPGMRPMKTRLADDVVEQPGVPPFHPGLSATPLLV